jgi:replicative DNA helicase
MTHLSKLEDYGNEFMNKVIYSFLKNRQFLLNIRDVVELEYFTHPGHYWIVDNILKYFDKYHISPTLNYFKIEVKKVENEILQTAIKEQLKLIYSLINEDQEYVEKEFDNFCINQKLKKALLDSVELLNQGDFEGIRFNIEQAIKAGQDKNLGLEYVKDIERRYREEERKIVPTPWNEINRLLQGGLGKGDFGLIYGNPGGGKSWCLVAIGCLALTLGYKVIHYTLELSEDYVGQRYDACLTSIPVQELKDHLEKIPEFLSKYENNIIIKEYPAKSASLSTIKAHHQKCKDLGFDADVILLDYVDLLKPPKSRKSNKEEIDDLYYGTKGLAKEIQIPLWSVSQVNRSGAREEVLEGDRSAGSYDKLMVVDFAMSQSRTKKDKTAGTARWHIMKNRYGSDGMTWNMKADLSMGHFEILGEYDDTEEYKDQNNKPKNDYQKVQKEEKEILLEKFKSFKIE